MNANIFGMDCFRLTEDDEQGQACDGRLSGMGGGKVTYGERGES